MNDYEYFVHNMSSLYGQYGHKFLVIKNKTIIGVYDDMDIAYDETRKIEDVGTFIIQECVDDPTKLVLTFQANVSVA